MSYRLVFDYIISFDVATTSIAGKEACGSRGGDWTSQSFFPLLVEEQTHWPLLPLLL